MQIALQMAWLKKGTTSPNPTVGAVLVKNNRILSAGVTQPAGKNHAEREALLNLETSETEGSTLYVTLEPCCCHGRTPPCTELIIEKKISRVVMAVKDTNPAIHCNGIKALEDSGIKVETGLLEKEATRLNADFFKWIKTGLPYVTLKYAMTLDGKMAAFSGDSKWITNERARKISHILRYRSDAILAGVNTVLNDDPDLNPRLIHRPKQILRVILDPEGKTPLSAKVASDQAPALFVVKENCGSRNFLEAISLVKNKSVYLDKTSGDQIDLKALLSYLGKEKQIVSLFVEGGSRTLGSFLQNKLSDAVFVFMGNQILGEGLSPFSGYRNNTMAEALVLKDLKTKNIRNNCLIYGYCSGID